MQSISTNQKLNTQTIIKVALLAAIGRILMFIEFPLPIFPSFLKIDISDIPAVVGTLSLGPAAGVIIELIKNILKLLTGTSSMGIGELANFIVGTAYILPLGIIYNKDKSVKGFIWGSFWGTLAMIVIASLFNYFILIPAYSKIIFNTPIDTFVGMANKVNGFVTDFKTLIIFAVAPFNLIKGIVMSILGVLLYNVLKPVLHKI